MSTEDLLLAIVGWGTVLLLALTVVSQIVMAVAR